MRILIITPAAIKEELGVSQVAINLSEALKRQGNEVVLWSAQPLKEDTRWWQKSLEFDKKLNAFIKEQKPFDIIDCQAPFISARLRRSAKIVIARSAYPPLLYARYLLEDLHRRSHKNILKVASHFFFVSIDLIKTLLGWIRADIIFCLGSREFYWMNKRFPWWKKKMRYYLHATSREEQRIYSMIRQKRQGLKKDGIRFLWIGRWAAHKGIGQLAAFIKERITFKPEETFTIAGCGNEAIKDFPGELLSAGRVRIIPYFSRKEFFTLLAEHDAGLFTSKAEGWGLTLQEMLESGMPVFSTEAGAVIDLIPYYPGLLYPFPPPLEIDTGAFKIPGDLSEYYSKFNWDIIAQDYLGK